jgi:tRNA-2-methylthio-N6-dimethylallyladenosine synthase
LLGQNVNAYHGDRPHGGELVARRKLLGAGGDRGLERMRYTTSHPRDMDDD